MKNTILIACMLMLIDCSSRKSSANGSFGDTRTAKVHHLNSNTYLLSVQSTDSTYAFTANNPVKVGGVHKSTGPINERKFLNALLGPAGESVSYFRRGSCCFFNTPNGFDKKSGLLDRYAVTWENSKDTFDIYINMYDEGDLYIPVGFTAKK